MAITFTAYPDDNYFLASFSGPISDAEFLDSYRAFFQSPAWQPGMNELADLEHADFQHVTSQGLRELQDFTARFLEANHGEVSRTAIYAPGDLPFGMARVYAAMAEGSPEMLGIFRDLTEARLWLTQRESSNANGNHDTTARPGRSFPIE